MKGIQQLRKQLPDIPLLTYQAGADFRQQVGIYTQKQEIMAINLRYQDLGHLPATLSQLETLQFLDISGNTLGVQQRPWTQFKRHG